ncbi:MAG TPA: proline dehydrogenase family protein [Chloroflexota bacterium]|nr:proline dehydrogenase family protein [Chloroflexota bacterium]
MAGNLFGNALLGVASQPAVAEFAHRSPLTQGLVRRFVAGETLDDALAAVRAIEGQGMHVALDHLGENTTSVAEAAAATGEAIQALEAVHGLGADAYISVKLTQMGLDLGEYIVLDDARRLLDRAAALDGFIRIDMEASAYTARTIELFSELRQQYQNVGIVLQAYLYRSMDDLRAMVSIGARVRLVKGAYREPPHISFRRKRDTDRNFVRMMEYMLREGEEPAIATHDPAIVEHACEFARQIKLSPDRFEFQMLYGVRRDLQEQLTDDGYRVRVYVPYGAQWYPYLTRRLAERPANLQFVLGSLLRR